MGDKVEQTESLSYTKGLIISQIALTTILIDSGAITSENVIDSLNAYVNYLAKHRPDDSGVAEPIKMIRDFFVDRHLKDDELPIIPNKWLIDFIGQA